MAWPNYHFVDLNKAEKQVRRAAINRYALYAQLSALVPIAIIVAYRLVRRAAASRRSRGDYAAVPSSPVLKQRRDSGLGSWASRARSLRWWLGEDVVVLDTVLGQRDQWLIGLAWTAWLLVLCVLETGDDYLHLTKRIAAVAVSQWPLQYLLAAKPPLNPVAYVLQTSHEQVNRWHRVLARITGFLIGLHAALYLAFFVRRGRLDRLGDPVVVAGVVAFLALNLLLTTALRPARSRSYRVFYVVHVLAGLAVPALLLLHARHARLFLAESLAAFLLNGAARKRGTVTADAAVRAIPGTDLIRISASVPRGKLDRFRAAPGAHVFLSLPGGGGGAARDGPASSSRLLFEFLLNPFTVASVDEDAGDLTLVARRRRGPMTAALGRLAGASSSSSRPSNSGVFHDNEERIPLCIEGPYGPAARLARLCTGYDRVLLVAGGIGATFALPLYRALLAENHPGSGGSGGSGGGGGGGASSASAAPVVEMVWAVRRAGDATWALTGPGGAALLKDPRLHLYVTGDAAPSSSAGGGGYDEGGEPGEELRALVRDRGGRYAAQDLRRRRPDLGKIVDGVFRASQQDRVAVLVCGPSEMARELRRHVGVWARKGREVWFHSEGFGY
ncbi:hypothetical protein VTJ83DRAFT_3224 [Remersonia thermophila]|uniref:FAD-binding FR-type domain-containing protein n=1 Tax=Remersonia thermophila TaxID=72144 RepID=A0ABR4DDF0_9PEZI